MTSSPGPTDKDSLQPRDELIAEAMAGYERDGQAALQAACLAHPELADELRRSAAMLDLLQRAAAMKPPSTRGGNSHATVPSSSIGPGTVIAGFRIEASLGGGGMGHVFRARDLELDRDVALKILSIPFASRESAVERIRKEARLLAQVRHDHIVRVFKVGETDAGLPFFVMDLVDGVPLSDVLGRLHGREPAHLTAADLDRAMGATRPPARGSYAEAVVRLILPIADALAAAHAAGVIHRDIKPGNILVDRAGRAHLVDFGIARETDSQSLSTLGHAGTPAYMAPEQVSGADPHAISAATDVYALGITLYEALTLSRPFEDSVTAKVYWRILNEEPPRPRHRNPAISADLETILLAAVEKRPADRYPGASELADDLRSLLELRPIRRRPLGRAARMLRLVRRHPWPTTATAALLLAAGAIVYATVADREAQRINRLVADGYAALGTKPPGYDDLRVIVAELNQLDPQRGEVLDFNESLQQHDVEELWKGHQTRATDALGELEPLLAEQGQLDIGRIDSLYETATTAINEMALLLPGRGETEDLLGKAFSMRHRSLLARSSFGAAAVAPASMAGLGDLFVEGAPAGASVHLFRYELQSALVPGGEPRLVAVPVRIRRADADGSPLDASTIERAETLIPPGSEVLVVEAVEADSPASRAGLKRGDVVVAVAGQPVHTRVVTLPPPGATTAASARSRLAGIAAFTPVTRLDGREVRGAFDLDFVLKAAREGEQLAAVLETTAADGLALERDVTVARTARGFEPALGLLADALSGPLPAEGVELVVVQGSARRSLRLAGPEATGLRLSPTCYPVVCSPDNCIGTLPLALTGLPAGSWLVVARAPGFEDLRLPVRLEAGRVVHARADMLPEATTPPGFVYVAPGPYLAGAAGRGAAWQAEERWIDGYWIGRTEITVGEYLEFLNDPETLAAIREGERTRTLLRVPREAIIERPARSTCRALWPKEDGRYVTSDDPRRPIKDITCEDADAYCRWRTLRSGDDWIFRLPSEDEWEKAARGVDGRACPWGDLLDFTFPRSQEAQDVDDDATFWSELLYEPVTRPTRDESPYGMRDAAGSVLEWCIGVPFTDIPFRRPWRGGFARGPTEVDLLCSRRVDGYLDRVGANDGFRIVAWRRSPGE